MNYRTILLMIILSATGLNSTAGGASIADSLEAAERAAGEARPAAMTEAYRNVLAHEPEHLEALTGLGTALSWQGDHEEALDYFRKALSIEPGHLPAHVGQIYALSWSGRYREADAAGEAANRRFPDNVEVQKALAYNALWSGQSERSLQRFTELASRHPADPEFHVATGWAHHQMGHERRAYNAFNEALTLDTTRADARLGLRAARGLPTLADLTIVGGRSAGADSGLRFLELGTFIGSTRIYAQYDNSLPLDNPTLARLGEEAETYQLGTVFNIRPNWLGVVEIGRRTLPDGDQDVYKAEVVHAFDANALQLGTQFARHDLGFTDRLIHVGWARRLNDRWTLNPHLYLAKSGAAEDDEWRFLVEGKYIGEAGWELIMGLGTGDIDSSIPEASGRLEIANAQISVPLGHHRAFATLSREQTPLDDFTVFTVGVQLRLARR